MSTLRPAFSLYVCLLTLIATQSFTWRGVHGQELYGRGCKETVNGEPNQCKKACGGDIDVRNNVQNLNQLINCTVIEGSLHIQLIDYAKPEEYEPYTFPDLIEITDHLLLYRVFGLKSLRTIFPNLAVIRGQSLFLDYALIAYEMPDMTDLGLVSLTSIPRGAVRLEKNTNLCFIETIDWVKIAAGVPFEDNYFKGNKDIRECVNRCPDKCDSSMSDSGPRKRCWSIKDCQKMLNCPDGCGITSTTGTTHGFCTEQGICCDKNCIGGCSGPSHNECLACRDVISMYSKGAPICASRCSPGTYKFKNRRCLLDTECLNFTDYPLMSPHKLVGMEQTSTEAGECVSECPAGYKDATNNPSQCVKCEKCAKTCYYGYVVDSVSSAQALKHCTIIKGPLIINMRGGDRVMYELEENLAQLEEVTDFIRIYDAFDLISLHFLKNLKVIGGQKLYKDRWAFVVYENLNLQELFLPNVTRQLKIGNGTVSFQANRKLCYQKIMELVNATGLMNKITDNDVAVDTNGDQVPCDTTKLKFLVMKTAPHLALLKWSVFNMTDQRHLISYTIHYKETEEKNISIYQGRDACSQSDWKSNEFIPETGEEFMFNYIHGLKPWTQYAAYVETRTISKANRGAVSDVIYFRTAAEVSTSPTNLQVRAIVPGELHVSWKPPDKPNGNISHYELYWQKRDLDPKEYELRDYCTDPLSAGLTDKQKEEEEEANNATMNGQCCKCPKSKKELKIEERERAMEIKFQDMLQNEVYLKRLKRPASTITPGLNNTKKDSFDQFMPPSNKLPSDPHEIKKYTIKPVKPAKPSSVVVVPPTAKPKSETTEPSIGDEDKNGTTTMSIEDIIEKRKKDNPYLKVEVYNKLEYDIPDLGHFEDYNIEVIACQERDPRDPDKHTMLCSHRALELGRTLPNATADTINETTIAIQLVQNKTGTVFIHWDDPPEPNGLILTYDLRFKKSNVQNVKPLVYCITYKMYIDNNRGHTLDKLEPGNYTLQLRATSIAGNGSWTEEVSFRIPDLPSKEWSSQVVIVVVVVIVAVVMVIAILAVWFIAKKRFRVPQDGIWSPNPDYASEYPGYEPDEWEVDRDNVQLIKELGQGSFGMVYEGIVKNLIEGNDDFRVAVKTTNTNSNDFDRYQFLQEASIMKAFHCHHVVKLMGVVSKGQPAYVLMELMPNGDLKNFLRIHRPDEEDNDGRLPPSLRQILQMAGEIADGMAYLADKKYVHRDLAARNCMVAEDMTVKIGDFGMTRDIYETDYYRKGNRGLLPVRWMAPESLRDGVFTSMSDVWSYGVVLWEMATLAAQPYQGLSNEEVLKYATSGKIMDMPERCPSKLYDLMVKCWRYRPKQRPTFKEIIEILLPDLDKNFKKCSYFFSEENAKYEESQKAAENNSHNDHIDHGEEEEEDKLCPINDYVDEANLPMLGAGASNGHSVELEDIFSDNGTYPHYSGSHKHVGSSEICDCPSFRTSAVDEGAAAQSADFNRHSVCSSPNSAIGGSSDGSKDSSKSSSSSYAHMNGLSVANGHVPMHVRASAPCYQ